MACQDLQGLQDGLDPQALGVKLDRWDPVVHREGRVLLAQLDPGVQLVPEDLLELGVHRVSKY